MHLLSAAYVISTQFNKFSPISLRDYQIAQKLLISAQKETHLKSTKAPLANFYYGDGDVASKPQLLQNNFAKNTKGTIDFLSNNYWINHHNTSTAKPGGSSLFNL